MLETTTTPTIPPTSHLELDRAAATVDEHYLYPTHEEDTVPDGFGNAEIAHDLITSIQMIHPHLWVTGNGCLYWKRDPQGPYVAPDIAIFQGPHPELPLPVWLSWADQAVLFVAELGSRSTVKQDKDKKVRIYEQDLKVPEYLFAYPLQSERQDQIQARLDARANPRLQAKLQARLAKRLWLWRMVEGRYVKILPNRDGRVWSEQLGVWFGWDDVGVLRAYNANGMILPSHQQTARQARAAEQRAATAEEHLQMVEQRMKGAEEELRRAEERAQTEAQQRLQAEERAQEEARLRLDAERQRIEAEQRAQQERTLREELERRLAQLTVQLEGGGGQKDAG